MVSSFVVCRSFTCFCCLYSCAKMYLVACGVDCSISSYCFSGDGNKQVCTALVLVHHLKRVWIRILQLFLDNSLFKIISDLGPDEFTPAYMSFVSFLLHLGLCFCCW